MAEKHSYEMFVVRWVPFMDRDEFVNLAIVLIERDESGRVVFVDVRFTEDSKKLNNLAPDLVPDLELLEEAIREMLHSQTGVAWIHEAHVNGLDFLLREFGESWSGALQATQAKAIVTSLPAMAELDLLQEQYLTPRRQVSSRSVKGRQAILREMQEAFKKQRVWDLMLKNIAAKDYGLTGDPFKIDLGYRPNGVVKTFHAVSMSKGERDQGRLLVHRWPKLRAGIMEKEKAQVELTAVVETELPEADVELESVMTDLLSNDIQVRKLIEMPKVAEQARVELRA